jgi:hypothetical protein
MAMYLFAGFATFFAGLLTFVIFYANQMKTSGEFVGRDVIGIAWMVVVVLWLIATAPAYAQEHRHKPEDADNHHKFYKSWMMPDNRAISCCHDEDCTRAEVQFKDGSWYARQVGDQNPFTKIPSHKVEQERDSPDGSSHLCGRRYFFSGEFTVFCFLPAAGH